MYCTNPRKPSAIHNLLADVVEASGGSRQLIKILNRIGCVSSTDTHDRFVTFQAEQQRNRSLWEDLNNTVFSIASTDNFDILQCYSAVYSGNQKRSYHGTTVQIVQPHLSLSYANNTTTSSIQGTSQTSNVSIGESSLENMLRRRVRNPSPSSSPHKVGKVGPKRPRTVIVRNIISSFQESPEHARRPHNMTIEYYKLSQAEKQELQCIHENLVTYAIQRKASETDNNEWVICDYRQFLVTNATLTNSPSRIHYLELVDEHADSDEAMLQVVEDLLDKYLVNHHQKWLVLVGDGKTYQHLMRLKKQYGEALSSLLIFPGDWHILKNYQEVIMKVYYVPGLKEIAKESGYRGKALQSLETAQSFKRTHHFLFQAWEALTQVMLSAFLVETNNSNLLHTVQVELLKLIQTHCHPVDILKNIQAITNNSFTHEEFMKYLEMKSMNDNTWKLWVDFVVKDCFVYIALYTAIRGRDWKLRVASLKLMAPLFYAFDRQNYERIIPDHLHNILTFPSEILQHLQAGGFAVNITDQKWHSVAIDEAHEMCVNKDLKSAISRPTQAYLQKTSLFFNYRIKLLKHFKAQLFLDDESSPTQFNSIIEKTTASGKVYQNIKRMVHVINNADLLPVHIPKNRGLINTFTTQKATQEQLHDMLQFQTLGEEALDRYITHFIIGIPSTSSSLRRHKVLTMASPKITKRKLSQKDKENKLVTTCLRRRLAWCNRTSIPYNSSEEQYSLYPRALADENGNPHKGSKSIWTDKFKKRYVLSDPQVFYSKLPLGWTPEVAIIDTMFLINTKPLRSMKTITEYTKLIFNRFVAEYFLAGVKQVHLIFDKPQRQTFNPKQFEQSCRDSNKVSSQHTHINFTPNQKPPNTWQEYINCRKCKRSIIEAIGLSILQTGRFLLQPNQEIVLAGCFSGEDEDSAVLVNSGNISVSTMIHEYDTNSEEADCRIWRHATCCSANNVLIYSPDTDVYNIGLHYLSTASSKQYIIQINVINAISKEYIFLNHLHTAFFNDPDLSSIVKPNLLNTLQTLFICTGCDFVSFFKQIGKASFF